MPSNHQIRKGLCRRLRWKGMFIEAASDPALPTTRDDLFWCTHTMNCLGPDGEVARSDDCRTDRECYEEL